MNEKSEFRAWRKALWAAEAMGVVLVYLGAFALLMYPVVDAAGFLA